MNYVPVASFDSYIEAHLLLGRLVDAGINARLDNEYTVTIDPILSNAIGGIKVIVEKQDLDQATALLNEWKMEQGRKNACPRCGSIDVQKVSSGKKPVNLLSGIFTFLMGSYAIPIEKVNHCFNCGHEWTANNQPDENNINQESEE
ncbi:MAG TPA: DUF2007 domain-containing protein [Parasegetibacter sp.]|jgi:hypothetical protein